MKQSNFFTKNGTIFHPGMAGIEKSILAGHKYIYVNCDNDEIFDELMTDIINKYPQAVGAMTTPNTGAKVGKRYTKIYIQINELYGITIKVTTDSEYKVDKVAIDKEKKSDFDAQYYCSWSGGNN